MEVLSVRNKEALYIQQAWYEDVLRKEMKLIISLFIYSTTINERV